MTQNPIEGLSHNGARRVFRVAAHLAWCDNELADSERTYLDELAARLSIRSDEVKMLEVEARAGDGLGVGQNPLEQQVMLEVMIDVTMSDGILSSEEQERLAKFAVTFGLGQDTLAARIVERIHGSGRKLQRGE
ncbi:MAG: TerB family tellurite resistance protein [Planctomycetes bacterium]|nr:TerB family tellurite resistance protein [Planctomycetota bacterium]